MKLTALEIKQQQFEKSLRGYDVSEVNAYLNLVANEWEHMVGKMKEMEAQLDKMDEKLKHYERVEQALHETLQTAKDSAEQKLVGAKKESRNIIEKAEMESDAIVREANQKRQQIRQSILRLLDRREEIIGGMKSYLEMAQDSLQHFSRDDASLFSLPKEDTGYSGEQEERRKQESASTKKRSQQKEEQPVPPGAENLDDILDDID
ncbi:DivIVA domain-containing protein [Rhodohalobacter sp. 8-1]|uniref:DivIVA domain-containing protein n=1 Tax=Rhodohalobacter sp. 8-1 TaxID=3131972 RepID=UPI0030ED57BC